MTVEELLERFPWPRTQRILWEAPSAEVPERPRQSVIRALRELIERHRASQLDELLGLIVSPVLASPSLSPKEPRDDAGNDLVHVLHNAHSSARLFIGRVVRVGKELCAYDPDVIEQLDRHNAELGKFLRTIALAAERQGAERLELQAQWRRISSQADLGLVLTPMAERSAARASPVASDATIRLIEAVTAELEKPALQVEEDLPAWVTRLVREGARRLMELRGLAKQQPR